MRDVTCSIICASGMIVISTHTSHAGRDSVSCDGATCELISTHTSHAGRDFPHHACPFLLRSFLLTRPMRDVTGPLLTARPSQSFLLTRPMRDVTTWASGGRMYMVISTHTSHAGRDGRG